MSSEISEEGLRKLKVVDIRTMPQWMGSLKREQLCMHRGIDLSDVVAGNSYFIDHDLGYLIANSEYIDCLKRGGDGFPSALDDHLIESNWRAKLADDTPWATYNETGMPWYVEHAGGWPIQRGDCIRIGIIDDGTSARLLKRGAADFAACAKIDGKPWSMKAHGEECAQTIAEPDSGRRRWSPAPNCRLISGQARRINHDTYMWFVDLLLMLSWTVSCRGAQIVNLSFNLGTDEIKRLDRRNLLSRIARDLRDQNRALLFAATDIAYAAFGFPALLEGFIAVGSYALDGKNEIVVNAGTGAEWEAKTKALELLFAPLGIYLPNGQIFSGTSGSCAYVSGVAALYIERYLDQRKPGGGSYTLNDIRLMLGDNVPPRHDDPSGLTRQVIRLHP